MVNIRRFNPWIGCLLMALAGLVGCAPKTNVSTTGNVPAQYTRVLMSVQEIWFNTSATAGPDDTGWLKFPLTTPVTVDLAASNGTLISIASGLAVPVGTYAQIRLIPVDSGAALLSSASSLPSVSGLQPIYNSEVDYTDTTGTLRQLPLELQNPDKGIGIATSIKVSSSGNSGSTLFSATTNSASTTGTTGTTGTFGTGTTGTTSTTGTTGTFGTGTTGTTSTTGTTGTFGTGTTGTTSTTGTTGTFGTGTTGTTTTTGASNITFSVAVNVDGAKDIVPFTYGPLVAGTATANPTVSNIVNGMLLNPHMTAYDASAVGAIAGTLTLTGLTGITSPSTNFDYIQVTAESLSTDGTRHIAVNSAPVHSDGTFTLYPLATSASSPTSYDLVIHGPSIATIIVKGVTVNVGTSSSTTTPTPVNIGTLTPRQATPFPVNVATATPLPAGALVGFYQTLPSTNGTTEVPYLIEQIPIDPFSRNFDVAQAISGETLDYGTFSGSAFSLTATNTTPVEGASTYRVAASAPLFTDGVPTATVSPAASLVTVPTLSPASGVTSTATISISKAATATTVTYNQGDLIVSHDGAIVATAVLDSIMGSAASTLTISGLPGGTGTANSALYYVSVRVWNSTDPFRTLNRVTYPTALDLSSGSTPSYSIQIP